MRRATAYLAFLTRLSLSLLTKLTPSNTSLSRRAMPTPFTAVTGGNKIVVLGEECDAICCL